ncbi:GW dipeptide domain-containing protein [Weissella confusa]|uniref:GW dipeptide domain-containing protein n=1 Tax=Weissella confusa TaxID=1583 RepID=UPI00107FC438|nr:GW dipeptide domain-containing protein [Weissella confusa]TGE60426.1 hypothetical protein C6P16_06770 [Weissella confusa]
MKNNALQASLVVAGFAAAFGIGVGNAEASTATDFISHISADSQKVTKQYNLYSSVQMAQASLESAWGQSTLSTKANNYFGIKGSYNGQSVDMLTAEYTTNGELYYTVAQFKKYPSPYESLNDNAALLRNGASWNPRYYAGTWRENAANYADAANSLTGRYATDPHYGSKLINLIQTYGLDEFDQSYDSATYKTGYDYTAKIVNQASRNDGVYYDGPYNTSSSTAKPNESAQKYNNQSGRVKEEATTKHGTYVHIFMDNGKNFWIDKGGVAFVQDAIISRDSTSYAAQVAQSNRNDGVYTDPYNTTVNAQLPITTGKQYNNLLTTVRSTVKTNRSTYVNVLLDGKWVWIDQAAVKKTNYYTVSDVKNTDYVAEITSKNDGMYSGGPYYTSANTVTPLASSGSYVGQKVHVTKTGRTPLGTYAYVTTTSNQSYWVDLKAISKINLDVVKSQSQTKYNASIVQDKQSDGIYTAPYNTSFDSITPIDQGKNYNGVQTEARATAVTNRSTYVNVLLGGRWVWIDQAAVKKSVYLPILEQQNVNFVAKVTSNNDGVFLDGPYKTSSLTVTPNYLTATLYGQPVTVTNTAITQLGTDGYATLRDGKHVWIDLNALTRYTFDAIVSSATVDYPVRINQSNRIDGVYKDPYNTTAQSVSPAAQGNQFNGVVTNARSVVKTSRSVYVNVYLNGAWLWIDQAAIVQLNYLPLENETTVSYNATVVSKNDGIYTSGPYMVNANSMRPNMSSAQYYGQTVQVLKTASTSLSKYGYVRANDGKVFWLDLNALKR